MTDHDKKGDTRSDPLASPVLDFGALLLDAGLGGIPAVSGAVAFARFTNIFLHRIGEKKAERAFGAHVDALVAIYGARREDAVEAMQMILEKGNEFVDPLLYQSFRRMVDSPDEASWPYIALLTACTMRGECSDTFCKRFGPLLARLEGEDIVLLHRTAVMAGDMADTIGGLDSIGYLCFSPEEEGMQVSVLKPEHELGPSVETTTGDMDRALSLCHMINSARLGPQNNYGFSEIAREFALPFIKIMTMPPR